jgi:hypothetical protein
MYYGSRTVSVKMKTRPTCRRRHRRRWRGPEPRALRNRRTAAAAPRIQPPGTPSTGTGRVTSETENKSTLSEETINHLLS